MTTQYCTSCQSLFIGMACESLCPKCENKTELPKASRKRGDKEKLMDFNKLFEDWKKLRKQREYWRRSESDRAQAMMERERLEKEKSLLLIALSAFDSDQDLLRQFVSAKNQLNVMTMEKNRIKGEYEEILVSLNRTMKENSQLLMENARLRFARPYSSPPQPPRSSASTFTKEMWRRFTQLCHPDRHENSAAANEATRWLLENRP